MAVKKTGAKVVPRSNNVAPAASAASTRTAAKRPAAKKAGTAPPRTYPDLHDHIAALGKAGLLVTVDRPINKDTEMHPLVRWQFRGGIEEKDRKAFLFNNVVDSKGRKYDIPVVVGALAANREIYRIGIGCELDQIDATWNKAAANPIPPRIVEDAPCHEIVIMGDDLDKPGMGLDAIPVPISTPGWDNAPYTTLSQYITKDPETGVQNMGTYRGQLKSSDRLGMMMLVSNRAGGIEHWSKHNKTREPMPMAIASLKSGTLCSCSTSSRMSRQRPNSPSWVNCRRKTSTPEWAWSASRSSSRVSRTCTRLTRCDPFWTWLLRCQDEPTERITTTMCACASLPTTFVPHSCS
jgi:hypothetical protein